MDEREIKYLEIIEKYHTAFDFFLKAFDLSKGTKEAHEYFNDAVCKLSEAKKLLKQIK